MKIRFLTLFLLFGISIGGIISAFGAGLLPSEGRVIEKVSISVGGVDTSTVENAGRSLGLKILSGAKLLVSGFALIYIVLIGVYMIIFSQNEDRIKSQRKQLIYGLIGFLFLNIPSLVYTVFFGPDLGVSNAGTRSIGDGSTIEFWDSASLLGANGFIPMMIGFFEIFIFGVAILMFTWGFFRLILSAGDEEVQKKAKGRIIYGLLGLVFLGFVKFWGGLVARGEFFTEVADVGKKFLGLALYFAAPVVIFFLVIASYYLITSGGDEERVKKGKSIFMNTFIATLILLGAYSFLIDLVGFSL